MDLTYRDWLILNCLILLSIGPGIRSDIFINLLDTNYFYGNSSYILNYFIGYDEFIDFRDHFVFGKDVIVPFETCGPSGCEA